MAHPPGSESGGLCAAIMIGIIGIAGWLAVPSASAAGACAEPAADQGDSLAPGGTTVLFAGGLDLACRPAVIHSHEGQWTFFLYGADAFGIDRARLVIGEDAHVPVAMRRPTPESLLIDFEYAAVPLGTAAHLEIFERSGAEPTARFDLTVTPSLEVAPENRQPDLVRVQLEPGVLQYLLHGIKPGDPVRERRLEELDGDEELIDALRALGITRMRKIMPRYAEDDSVHWDPRYLREIHYPGRQLRQYVMFLDQDWSEAAYKEIFLSLPHVEKAFVNEDRSKRRH